MPAVQYQPDAAYGGMFVQTAGDPAKVAEAVRRVMQQLSPAMPLVSVRPMWELVAPEARSWQLGATLFTAFGVLALIVAALGLHL